MIYDVIYAGDFEDLSRILNEKLLVGWRPQGGVAAYNVMEKDNYGTQFYTIWYMQAIVKGE